MHDAKTKRQEPAALLAAAALLFTVVATSSNNALGQPAEFLAYENAREGINLDYPSDWTPVEASPGDDPTFAVGFVSPRQDADDQFAESLAINIETVPEDITLQEYTEVGNQTIRTIFPDAEMTMSTDDITLSGEPAHIVTYSATLDDGTSGQITQVWTVTGGKAYVLTYRAESDEYQTFTEVVDRMIGTFQITEPAVVSESIPAATTANNATDFESARQQFLSVWQQIPFNASFSTFIDRFSDQGYGIYTEHRSNIFAPDDTIVLYLEPVGFTHKPVLGEQGEQLYEINLTATVQITQNLETSPEAVQAINQTISDIESIVMVSHRQNTELFLTIPINLRQLDPSFPEGDYTITYEITDGDSGQSFTLEKEIRIAETVSPTT
jgi:hypothetical protein